MLDWTPLPPKHLKSQCILCTITLLWTRLFNCTSCRLGKPSFKEIQFKGRNKSTPTPHHSWSAFSWTHIAMQAAPPSRQLLLVGNPKPILHSSLYSISHYHWWTITLWGNGSNKTRLTEATVIRWLESVNIWSGRSFWRLTNMWNNSCCKIIWPYFFHTFLEPENINGSLLVKQHKPSN